MAVNGNDREKIITYPICCAAEITWKLEPFILNPVLSNPAEMPYGLDQYLANTWKRKNDYLNSTVHMGIDSLDVNKGLTVDNGLRQVTTESIFQFSRTNAYR